MMPRALALAAAVVVLDQASKWIILTQVMTPPRTLEVTGFFNLVLAFNRGVSFGLLASHYSWKPYLLAALALAVVGLLLYWVRRQPGWGPTTAVALPALGLELSSSKHSAAFTATGSAAKATIALVSFSAVRFFLLLAILRPSERNALRQQQTHLVRAVVEIGDIGIDLLILILSNKIDRRQGARHVDAAQEP